MPQYNTKRHVKVVVKHIKVLYSNAHMMITFNVKLMQRLYKLKY